MLGSEARTGTKILMVDDIVDTYPQQSGNLMRGSSMVLRDQLTPKKHSSSPIVNFIGDKIDRM